MTWLATAFRIYNATCHTPCSPSLNIQSSSLLQIVLVARQGQNLGKRLPNLLFAQRAQMTTSAGGFYDEVVGKDGAYLYYVNGKWQPSSSAKTVSVTNPFTRQTAYQVQGAQPAAATSGTCICSQLTLGHHFPRALWQLGSHHAAWRCVAPPYAWHAGLCFPCTLLTDHRGVY